MTQALGEAGVRHLQAVGGRVPPHDLDAEESLLGAMLLSRDAIVAALECCSAEDFYKPAHGHVFSSVTALYTRGEPADPVTVADELRRSGLLEAVGGGAALISLQINTPSTANAAHYARIVEELALLRRLVSVAGEIAELGYSVPEDVSEVIDHAETLVFEVAQRRVVDTVAPLRELLAQSLDHLESLYERGDTITGVPTGYADLDDRLAGLQNSNLVVVGARPAMGKTSFALGIVNHAAVHARVPVLLFSLEMSHLELTQRLLCSEARVDATRMRNGRLLESDWPKISDAIGRLGDAPVYIDDNPNVTVMDIRAKSRRLKAREGLGLVVVDYLQLMSGHARSRAENRQVEVSEISRGLKVLARELNIPVVALSQLSRNLEQRQDKRPVLADLRESGCLVASTRVTRADTGEEVALGELVDLEAHDVPVWALGDDLRLEPARLTRAFPSGVKPVFEMLLGSGRRVRASGNHPFRTPHGWLRLDELAVGDRVATPRRLPEPRCPVPMATRQLVALASSLAGVGTPATAQMPAAVFALPQEQLAAFLRHLWGHGGGAWPDAGHGRVRCRFTCGHRRLAEDVQSLLLRFGVAGRVVAARSAGSRPNFHVVVTGADDQRRFLLEVGVAGAGEVAAAAATDLLEQLRPRTWRANGGFAHASAGDRRATFSATAAAHALSPVRPRSGAREGPATRPMAAASVEADPPGPVAADACGGVSWDAVVAIVPAGHAPVYDATVPGPHNFLANGVVAHNSIEQDADVVLFIYRDELYNPDSPDRGTAEILVAKHRNGPTGVTQLAFVDHYTRFANMARV